jgi:hypothetical protein
VAGKKPKPKKPKAPKVPKAEAESPASDVPVEACKALVPVARPGRPTMFTPDLALRICCRIAEGESLRSICSDTDMPNKATVLRWVLIGETAQEGSLLKQFRDQYARAREIQAHLLGDEIIEIADTPMPGIKTEISDKGIKTIEGDMIDHRRLRVDTRKWYLCHVLPKLYGDKVAHEVSGPQGGPIQIQPVPKFDNAQEFARWVEEQQRLRPSAVA